MRDDDLPYYRRRAVEETERVLLTRDPAVAAIHRELAARYIRRTATLADGPQLATIPKPIAASA